MVWAFLAVEWLWSAWKSYGTRVSTESGKSARPSSSPTPSAAERSSTACLPRTEELLVALVAGDLVVYKAHREWGTGIVEWVVPDGLLVVAFEVAGKPYRSDFGEGELERATPRIARTA
jgi:hypothetical protein